MATSVVSAASTLGVSAEALEAFLQLITLTSKPVSVEQSRGLNIAEYGALMDSLIEEYDSKL